VRRAWITGTNPLGEIDSGRVPNTRTSLEKMPKVRARHRGDALATATGERAPSPATSRSRAAIYALERLELRSTRCFGACAARPAGPLFRERREKTATLAGNVSGGSATARRVARDVLRERDATAFQRRH
jgi:hypothetical protein